jgi:hypothetical protein
MGMLDFHGKVYKSTSGFGLQETEPHLAFAPLWKDFQLYFRGILQSLRNHEASIETEMQNIRIQEQIQVSKFAQMQQTAAWLAGDDAVQDLRLERLRLERQIQNPSDSIEWFVSLPDIINWEADDATEPILWLHGRKAGTFDPGNLNANSNSVYLKGKPSFRHTSLRDCVNILE